jgi:hypothetical protein
MITGVVHLAAGDLACGFVPSPRFTLELNTDNDPQVKDLAADELGGTIALYHSSARTGDMAKRPSPTCTPFIMGAPCLRKFIGSS